MKCFIQNKVLKIILGLICSFTAAEAQQININRIELMPNIPSPYEMRDWKKVAAGYDSLVFDFDRTDDEGYLPLICIDKSNQNGYNWVLMCEEYFNKANNANVYLNHQTGSDWNDWWYDVMPNIFFYQLYNMYSNTGDFSFQFTSVADRWLEAVDVMGGSTTPWYNPNMNHCAFNLMTMTPFSSGDPVEPEAAGAIAWILYNAYVKTNDPKYRIGAEWAMEFLNGLTSNPSYELQLPYGAYTAARMNAELGTTYNISKIINWCFDIGYLRGDGHSTGWGAILGKWGGYDVNGLIGEVNGANDYAFLMNTFEQIG